jgi:hypothetical protein
MPVIDGLLIGGARGSEVAGFIAQQGAKHARGHRRGVRVIAVDDGLQQVRGLVGRSLPDADPGQVGRCHQ